MNSGKISEMIKRRPSQPFRLHTSDGTTHEVRHPDQIMIDRTVCYVGIGPEQDGVFQRVATISNIHVTHLEPFDPPERKSA